MPDHSYLSSKKLEAHVGQISTQLNSRPKGGLPCDKMVNPKNDSHVMAIITRSGQTLGEEMVEIHESPNKNSNYDQESSRIKQLGKPSDDAPKSNKAVVKKPMVVEEKGNNEETPKVINGDAPKVN